MRAAKVIVSAPGSRMRRPVKQALEMSPAAVQRLKSMLDSAPQPSDQLGFKLGVKARGCNGMAYTLDFAPADQQPGKGDEVVVQDGVRVQIDSKALMYVVGTRMDFVEDDIRSEFVFENPNATGTCGCGESFNVVRDKA